MHSPLLKLACSVSCLVSALGALHVGLNELGYNIFAMTGLHNLYTPFAYIVGVAGAVSLVLYVLKLSSCAGGSCDTYGR